MKTAQIPVAICGPFEGARLLCTAPITGIFGAPIPANVRLVAGEIDSTDGKRFLTVTGRSPLGAAVEVNVWEEVWDKLVFLLDSPLALCHAARWLAVRLGMDPGATAPRWYRQVENCIPVWILETDSGCFMFWSPLERCYVRERVYVGAGQAVGVDGISNLTDPVAALAAACMAVGGAA